MLLYCCWHQTFIQSLFLTVSQQLLQKQDCEVTNSGFNLVALGNLLHSYRRGPNDPV